MSTPPYLVVYDAECSLCQAARRWFEHRAPQGVLEFLDCRSEARSIRAPQVAESACLDAIHVVDAGGEVFVGADALPALLGVLPHWHWFGRALRWPLFRRLARPAYRAIARNRLSLSVLFPKGNGGDTCENDNCSLR